MKSWRFPKTRQGAKGVVEMNPLLLLREQSCLAVHNMDGKKEMVNYHAAAVVREEKQESTQVLVGVVYLICSTCSLCV